MPFPIASTRFARQDLEGLPLFTELDCAGWDLLLSVARPERPAVGEYVQHAGHPGGRIAVVLSGGLRIVHLEPTGASRIVRLLGVGDHIGEAEYFLNHPPVHSAFALRDTRLCVIPHTDFDLLASAQPPLVRALLESTLRRLLSAEILLSSQISEDVLTRLATFLLELPGPIDATGRRRVTLPSSQVDVASYLGTTPETLSRRLHKLIDSDIVNRTDGRHGFALDTSRLAELIGSTNRPT